MKFPFFSSTHPSIWWVYYQCTGSPLSCISLSPCTSWQGFCLGSPSKPVLFSLFPSLIAQPLAEAMGLVETNSPANHHFSADLTLTAKKRAWALESDMGSNRSFAISNSVN